MDPSLPRQPFGSPVHLSPSHSIPGSCPWHHITFSFISAHLPLSSFLVTALPIKLMSSAPRSDSGTIHVPYPLPNATLGWAW